MNKRCVVRNVRTGEVILARATWCRSFWCHFKGLMLRRRLAEDEGLVFVFRRESITETTIHMFFMQFAIAAIWVDDRGTVVDAKLARPWRPFYAPARRARYVIEARPVLLDRIQMGDTLRFEDLDN